MTAILRLQLDDKDSVRVNSAINQLAEVIDRGGGGGGARTFLTANTIFYVSTTGSDTNSGMSAGSPFLTIQHAYNVVTNTIDLGGQSVTIQCASGIYTTGLSVGQPWTGGGNVTLDLGGGTISSGGDCLVIGCVLPNVFTIKNGILTSSGGTGIDHLGTGIVVVGTGMTFGAVNRSHMGAQGSGCKIQCFNAYTITGGANAHYLAGSANVIQGSGGGTITITGTPAVNFFAYATQSGSIVMDTRTFSGSTTGQRYQAETNGVIFTGGAGANYFPGTIPGATDATGVYI